jgi:hypothetical protein
VVRRECDDAAVNCLIFEVLAAAMDAASTSSSRTSPTLIHPQQLLELWSREITRLTEASSSGGQHPAGTAKANGLQKYTPPRLARHDIGLAYGTTFPY